MTTYVIGDLHGCGDEFSQLLEQLQFNLKKDTLWLTGDLINRGPRSLDTLRAVRDLGDTAVTVLGNHDLHLLGCWAGFRQPRRGDTVNEILDAPDADELCHWLRKQPLWVREDKHVLVHAGIYPGWKKKTAATRAKEFESLLSGDNYLKLLEILSADKPPEHDLPDLSKEERLRFTAAAFTLMRYVDKSNLDSNNCPALNLSEKTAPGKASNTATPWFEAAGDKFSSLNVFTGHWAALGHRQLGWLTALDSGCVWGGSLTAVKRDKPKLSCCVDCSDNGQ